VAQGYHHGALHGALIGAALQALERDGKLPTWRALARACGVSQSAPYRHFDSYERLQAAVIAECFRRMIAALDGAPVSGGGPEARLAAGIRGYVEFGRAHPAWYRLMFGHLGDVADDPEVTEAATAAFARLERALGACGVHAVTPVASALWSALHGLVDLLRIGIRPVEGGEGGAALVARVVEMQLAYVRAVVAAQRRPKR